MYDKLYNTPPPTNNDLLRMQEIKFYLLVYKLITIYQDPGIIVETFEILAKLLDCNPLHILQLVQTCFKKDPAYVPRQAEVHALLYKCGLSVRKITEITKASNQTFYSDLKKYISDPYDSRVRLNSAQSNTLTTFMTALDNVSKIFKVW